MTSHNTDKYDSINYILMVRSFFREKKGFIPHFGAKNAAKTTFIPHLLIMAEIR
jgi:hypothetical protein